MLHVKSLHSDFDAALVVGCDGGASVANPGLHVGNYTRDACDHPSAILGDGEELYRVSSLLGPRGPFHRYDALRIYHQLLYVLAARSMHCDTFAAGDIADDLFAVQRIAATGAIDHQILDAMNHNRVVAGD